VQAIDGKVVTKEELMEYGGKEFTMTYDGKEISFKVRVRVLMALPFSRQWQHCRASQ
jgi:hypothetical protein